MKKMITLLLAVMMVFSLAACGSKEPANTLKEGVTLESIVTGLAEEYEMAASMELSKDDLAMLLEMDAADIEECYALMAVMNVSADHCIAVKAAEGKAESVAEALQGRLEFERATFERYLQNPYEKALAGKVITVGDYVVMFILGLPSPEHAFGTSSSDLSYSEQAVEIEKKIMENFNV